MKRVFYVLGIGFGLGAILGGIGLTFLNRTTDNESVVVIGVASLLFLGIAKIISILENIQKKLNEK